jgi:hypothetical protein
MRARWFVSLLTLAVLAAVPSAVAARHRARPISVGFISQQVTPGRAVIGTSIGAGASQSGGKPGGGGNTGGSPGPSSFRSARTPLSPPPYPVLASDSALLKSSQPFGAGTFWYPDGSGQECIYLPNSSPLCFAVTSGAAPVAISPSAIASTLADQLNLQAGAIAASPATEGVTGVASWFWLSPTPGEQDLSESLDGETVSVEAVPSVSWQFGDGTTLAGSAGVPYQPGSPPPGAVTHVFQTRCLPGDQGANPYVLSSCGPDGYQVASEVSWQISYQASGPISDSGTLLTRTTDTQVAYPVTEVRGFLLGGATP